MMKIINGFLSMKGACCKDLAHYQVLETWLVAIGPSPSKKHIKSRLKVIINL